MTNTNISRRSVIAVVPAAGIGSRMKADSPKQYLPLGDGCILGKTLALLLSHDDIQQVVVALNKNDTYFNALPQAAHPKLKTVEGGKERADSVLMALKSLDDEDAWVLVHDAARPCLTHHDIDKLLAARATSSQGAILAAPVRDTMKRADNKGCIAETVSRVALWHALTPQLFPLDLLRNALEHALSTGEIITDEASAVELQGIKPALIEGRADNIKVTHPDDLALAELYLMQHQSVD